MNILAIDPGTTESAYVVIDEKCEPLQFGKVDNWVLRADLWDWGGVPYDQVAIEMVASYGMAVGAEVFETCVWIGRFAEAADNLTDRPRRVEFVKRHPVKLHHCHSSKANDSNIRQALVDRFAYGQPNHGKGTKSAPGFFFGFHSDIWQSYALAVYVADTIAAGGEL